MKAHKTGFAYVCLILLLFVLLASCRTMRHKCNDCPTFSTAVQTPPRA